MRDLLKKLLTCLHLLEFARRIYGYLDTLNVRMRLKRDFLRFFKEIANSQGFKESRTIFFTGILHTPQKPTLIPFFRRIADELKDTNVLLLDEAPHVRSKAKDYLGLTCFHVPRAIVGGAYDTSPCFQATPQMLQMLEEKEYLSIAVENLVRRQKNMNRGYATALVCYYDQMYRAIIQKFSPQIMVIWSQFPALHQVCAQVCKEHGVRPYYLEYGSLPGTFGLENGGQMGESWVSASYEEFLKLPVDEQQLDIAKLVHEYLRESKLNRNAQPQNDELEKFRQVLVPGKPLILFAGQSDYDSGIFPYTEHSKTYHSPMFQSSMEAMEFLAELAAKNDWHLVFKPHPQMARHCSRLKIPSWVTMLSQVNLNDLIDMADVVVTIVSQTAYVSLIRGRATMMMGYNQLRGKGCTYEAFQREDIENVLAAAIREGHTSGQQEAFQRHIAQMLAYYLYDDMTKRPIRFGQDVAHAAAFLKKGLTEENEKPHDF